MTASNKKRYLIVGGVAGGATAAARIRRVAEDAEIVLFEKGAYISYANCGLPYYIGGVIEDRNRLFVQTPEAFGKRFAFIVHFFTFSQGDFAFHAAMTPVYFERDTRMAFLIHHAK